MEHFTNETIDTKQLPKFEEVAFSKLHPSYWKVMLVNIVTLLAICLLGAFFIVINVKEIIPYQVQFFISILMLIGLILFFARLSFNKRGFAFRNHDVLFRQGIIATNTMVIPYNRIQHVALHEGIISRLFGLAKVEIFTAGGHSSDIEIPGIKKEEAENIKQLLMGKIQKEL